VKNILTLAFLSLMATATSQTISVEKSVFGVQTGFLGIWVHNELKLSNTIALRSEIGLDGGIWGGSFYEKTGFLLVPVFTAEPRWYYNLSKRNNKSKSTAGNSGNFISLKTSYHPDWFVISNYENLSAVADISMIPTWGIRRNMGEHFNFEAGFGIGIAYYFSKQAGYAENEFDAAGNLHLRIGYRF
jgi:hypothetical protein